MTWKNIGIGIVFAIGFSAFSLWADPIPSDSMNWQQWLTHAKQEAIAAGISESTVDNTLTDLSPDSRVLGYSRTQPEGRLTFLQYRQSRGDDYRTQMGVREYKHNAPLLNRIAREYGVSPCAIVSLWGMETSYGHYMGKFSVIRSLSTLAFGSDRSQYFNEQLMLALRIVDEGHIDNSHYLGEWAGASGQPQFMPSSFQNYAVDYDGDGRKNIWTSLPDVFASIANYLVGHGWQTNAPWGYEVNVPTPLDLKVGENNWYSVAEWQRAGVTQTNGQAIPDSSMQAQLLMPEGGPGLLVFPNFFVFKAYNNSTYYAGTVSHMANAICQS